MDLHLNVLDGHLNWGQDDLLLVSHLSNRMQQVQKRNFHEKQSVVVPVFWFWCMGSGWRWWELFSSCIALPALHVATVRRYVTIIGFVSILMFVKRQIGNPGANKRSFLPSTTHSINSEGRGVDEPADVVVPLVRSHTVPQLWWWQSSTRKLCNNMCSYRASLMELSIGFWLHF